MKKEGKVVYFLQTHKYTHNTHTDFMQGVFIKNVILTSLHFNSINVGLSLDLNVMFHQKKPQHANNHKYYSHYNNIEYIIELA